MYNDTLKERPPDLNDARLPSVSASGDGRQDRRPRCCCVGRQGGSTKRARAGAVLGRFKQVIGGGLRSRTDRRRTTEVDVAVHALNRMLELGRLISVRIA